MRDATQFQHTVGFQLHQSGSGRHIYKERHAADIPPPTCVLMLRLTERELPGGDASSTSPVRASDIANGCVTTEVAERNLASPPAECGSCMPVGVSTASSPHDRLGCSEGGASTSSPAGPNCGDTLGCTGEGDGSQRETSSWQDTDSISTECMPVQVCRYQDNLGHEVAGSGHVYFDTDGSHPCHTTPTCTHF